MSMLAYIHNGLLKDWVEGWMTGAASKATVARKAVH